MPTVPGVTRHTLDGIRTAPGPDPPDSSRCLIKGVSHAGSSRTPLRPARRTQTIWQYWPVPALSGLLPPSPAPPGSGCPQLHRPAATGSAAKVSHLHSNHSASRRTHDTRHTVGALLVALGVHPRVAMAILRHSQISITMEIYSHVTDEQTREALRKLGDLLT
jgi:integrase